MVLPFPIKGDHLLRELVPYVVATPANLPLLELQPFGLPTPSAHVIDPLRLESAVFLDLLHKLDGLTFGPEGMPMPKWVFYDCSELPGAIYGLARPAATVWPKVRSLFQIPADYAGLVPVSMYVAIPMPQPGMWFGHNLSSLAPVFRRLDLVPDLDLAGLGSLTKGLALKCFRVQQFWGATQWQSKALYIHAKFGPLALQTAYTPAHSEHETLTYGFRCTDGALRASMGDPGVQIARPPVDAWIDGRDVVRLKELQAQMERGEAWCIPQAPRPQADGMLVPIARWTTACS
ncbi:MAG: hypothetical protein FJ100_01350 [Deltaproteobacteria bacterium]|nr:hypothetical protein [Deltaproteobacteria bacterium]